MNRGNKWEFKFCSWGLKGYNINLRKQPTLRDATTFLANSTWISLPLIKISLKFSPITRILVLVTSLGCHSISSSCCLLKLLLQQFDFNWCCYLAIAIVVWAVFFQCFLNVLIILSSATPRSCRGFPLYWAWYIPRVTGYSTRIKAMHLTSEIRHILNG